LEIPELLVLRYQVAFLKGDQVEMERIAARGREKSGTEEWVCNLEAAVLACSGHLRQSRLKWAHAVELAQQVGHHERAAGYQAEAAVREILFGNVAEGRRIATGISRSHGQLPEYGTALALS